MLLALCSVSIISCKDDDDDPIPAPITSVICDGKGSLSYYPLAVGNRWVYTVGGDTTLIGV